MGYYTSYNLEVRGFNGAASLTEEKLVEIEKAFDEIFGESGYFTDLVSGDFPQWKWYDHDYDMTKLSAMFPDVIFTLEGEGEEKEDWWICEYWNGNAQKSVAKITPPSGEFNWDDFS